MHALPSQEPRRVSDPRIRRVSVAGAYDVRSNGACAPEMYVGLATLEWTTRVTGLALRELDVDSVPVNFLDARPGTPLEGRPLVEPDFALRMWLVYNNALLAFAPVSLTARRGVKVKTVDLTTSLESLSYFLSQPSNSTVTQPRRRTSRKETWMSKQQNEI